MVLAGSTTAIDNSRQVESVKLGYPKVPLLDLALQKIGSNCLVILSFDTL